MKLLIVSHTPHYLVDGQPVGWGPTVREIDQLAGLFESVIHLAVLYDEPAPSNSLGYQADNIRFLPVRPSGGSTWLTKLGVLRAYPGYWRSIRLAVAGLGPADCVHVRCPANLSLLAIGYLAIIRNPEYRWVKYAGNWQPAGSESLSYTIQRWWLKHNLHRGIVTVNGKWRNQPRHVITYANPSLTELELEQSKLTSPLKHLNPPYRLLFVGRLDEEKGAGRVLRIAEQLHSRCIDFHIDLVGDGPDRNSYEAEVKAHHLDQATVFHGWIPGENLNRLYQTAHFLVLPSISEGWPKVLSEGMAYGAVPVASAVSSIPQILNDFHIGKALHPYDVDGFAQAIQSYLANPGQWKAESLAGLQAAEQFTYDHYLQQVREMFLNQWGINLPMRT